VTLKAQYKQIFDSLVAGEAPLAYNCSAGQDRTGIATALILSALGVPRHVIYSDYHLSTEYRRPDMERGGVDYAKHAPTNAMARMFVQYASSPQGLQPQPLYTANGESYLAATFAQIDKTYGSVEAYLAKELGVDAAGVAKLRATYLE
jgi:protein-tyrosine phosphatase